MVRFETNMGGGLVITLKVIFCVPSSAFQFEFDSDDCRLVPRALLLALCIFGIFGFWIL